MKTDRKVYRIATTIGTVLNTLFAPISAGKRWPNRS